jgi:hypothetical protein
MFSMLGITGKYWDVVNGRKEFRSAGGGCG